MNKILLLIVFVAIISLGFELQKNIWNTTMHFNTLSFYDNQTEELTERRVVDVDFMVVHDEFPHLRFIDNTKNDKEKNTILYWIMGPPEKKTFHNGTGWTFYKAFSENDNLPCFITIPKSKSFVIIYFEDEMMILRNIDFEEEDISKNKENLEEILEN
jgi:hypothetical protein